MKFSNLAAALSVLALVGPQARDSATFWRRFFRRFRPLSGSARSRPAYGAARTVRVPSRHGRTYSDERRDHFLALLARLHVPVGRAVRLEPVAGAVITSPHARTQTELDRGWLIKPGVDVVVEPWQELDLRRHLGLAAGCDLSIGKPGFSFLSTFRLSDTGSYSTRYDDRDRERLPAQYYPGGYPRWTLRMGAGVRVAF